jgi:thioesterase domain-containing protein
MQEVKMTLGIGETLYCIWQQTFNRPVGLDDNFFELGGNPSIALAMFREFEGLTGRRESPLLIYQAPTISSLANLLQSSAMSAFPPAFALKKGTGKHAIFLAHGLGGNITEFFDLVQFIRSTMPIYGLQSRGADGVKEPDTSIEQMAHFQLQGVRSVQPRGPYVLIGYSLGGLVTLEMARLLSQQGERVALLMMIDSYPALRLSSTKQRAGVLARRVGHKIQDVLLPSKRLRFENSKSQSQAVSSLEVFSAPLMKKLTDSANLAWQNYEPGYYHGDVKFVKAAVTTDFPADPAEFWSKRVDRLELESVPGKHSTLLTEHSARLARVISKHLNDCSDL